MSDQTPAEKEKALADSYLETAILGREVASHALAQALKEAKAGTLRDPSKTAQSAIIASGVALDKRLVLQERPTQYVQLDVIGDGQRLLDKLGIAVETTAREIPQSYGKPRALTQADTPELESPTLVETTGESTSPSPEREPKTRDRVYNPPVIQDVDA